MRLFGTMLILVASVLSAEPSWAASAVNNTPLDNSSPKRILNPYGGSVPTPGVVPASPVSSAADGGGAAIYSASDPGKDVGSSVPSKPVCAKHVAPPCWTGPFLIIN